MNCKVCGTRTQVFNTRGDGIRIVRQRFCPNCGMTIYSEEHEIDEEEGMSFLRELKRGRRHK